MGKKGGMNKMKRLAAPRTWDISRKSDRFVFKPLPGPHSISASYPLGVVIRDLASMATLSRELKYMTKTGKVMVDGRERHTPRFPVGLFNVVSVPAEGVDYRLVPTRKGLRLAKVAPDEATKKLCSINTKTKVKGGHIQYGLHDGRSVLDDDLDLAPGDAVLLEVPSQKVLGNVKLAKGSLGLVLSGDRAGQLGKISDVKKGTISREKMVKISLPSGEAEVPSRLVFPVGTSSPLITVGVGPS
ncbi:MAG: 30S ribosomal protein S4e [Nitrososphaerota archaeon]|nr:30S ribosomal protein S4e [Nitrososphaerota archaeon]MDG6942157.1 30S ribosomal protein S4e [Nitrososphaerota archaeon]MDG6948409.1 30S ribosomal protein S4e [Nitrososphaerota archaeon]MDG6950335.1 30S ribosomal protein S4e [Nitrososphaerota archaeon]